MLKIGWSKRDVSTDKPVNLPGQFHRRPSRGVLDPITINCLVIENEDIVIFISGDFVSGGNMIDVFREKVLSRRPDFPASKMIFNITHTHCGADIRSKKDIDDPNIYSATKYQEYMSDLTVDAILEAYDNRAEGYIGYGYGYAAVAHSRRTTYSDNVSLREGATEGSSLMIDGHARMYGNTNDDKFIGFEGGADHYSNFMFTFDRDKNLTGAIINIPCPSQNSELEYYLTADYWHNVREILYAKYGDIGILPQCAAAGDLSPRPLHYSEAEKRRFSLKYKDYKIDERVERPTEILRRKDIAERICASFDEVFEWAKEDLLSDAEVSHTVKTIKLEKLLITDEQYKDSITGLEYVKNEKIELTGDPVKDNYELTVQKTKINRYQNIINRYEAQQTNPTSDMELHVIKIGDIAFATNPYELYIDFQHQIQARSPFTQTFIIQLVDQPTGNPGGYLATERGMENLGYSANIYSNVISPEGGHQLVEETLKELKKIY